MPTPETLHYRTKDSAADYVFEFVTLPSGGERAYIVRQPPYRGRDEGAHPTHRLTDGGRKYICWDSAVRTRADMKNIASLWADKTQQYIKTGQAIGVN